MPSQRQRQILRLVHLSQSRRRANGQLREIHAAALAKHQLQFGHRQREHGDRGLHGLPLRVGERGRGQFAQSLQALEQIIFAAASVRRT